MNKLKYILILITLAITGCSTENSWEVTGDIKGDLNKLLSSELAKFNIMNGVKQTDRQIELNNKFKSGIQKNYEWFQTYLKELNLEEGQPTPYHENFELTESEYHDLQSYLSNIKLVSTGLMMMNIEKSESTIVMTPSDQTQIKKIRIDLEENYVMFDSLKLKFSDTLRVTDNSNAFNSSWTGYEWRLEPNIDSIDILNLEDMSIYQFKLIVGQFKKKNQTYISIKGREVVNGIQTKDFNYPLTKL